MFLALKDKETPVVAKMIAAVTVGYALSPIDFIPDLNFIALEIMHNDNGNLEMNLWIPVFLMYNTSSKKQLIATFYSYLE